MARGQIFEVEVSGLDVLQRKLQPGNFFTPVRQNMIREAADAGHKKGQKAAKPHSGDTGRLSRGIRLTFQDGGRSATIDMDSGLSGLGLIIEEGRRPGRRPPRKAAVKFLTSHDRISTGRGEERAIVDDWREGIRASGTKGIHFMAQAADHADNVLHQRVGPTERAIERKWNA